MIGSRERFSIIFAAGGTGGHLYPAIALAREFLKLDPQTEIVFVGTTRGIEKKVLAYEGLPFHEITARPFMGRQLGLALLALAVLPFGILQSLFLLRRQQARLVIGVGGYTSPPLLFAAFLMRVPRVILEPNAYPGMANKVLGFFADRVFLGFDSAEASFPRDKVRVVGVPVRPEFFQQGENVPEGLRPMLLIFGGSQGARVLNQSMVDALPYLASYKGSLEVVHQTGEGDLAWVQDAYREATFSAKVVPYLFDMPNFLRSATLVVARAGAMTLAEVTVCGRPSILIPFPHAIYDHQTRNARVLETAGAAVMIPQEDLNGPRLSEVIDGCLKSPNRLAEMGKRSRALGRADAAEHIVQECRALAEVPGP